jgi:hypothetical protein
MNMNDSVAIHGLSTLFTAAEIISIINNGYKNFPSCFFYNL